ncbi:VOC family protein [Dactylosporangium sp. NPDC051541]|uniref:VOC family protein n=1 Tax=Dactylosporangium sp. NPDC051541 TaxID=3363977 RepID=UPI0037BCB6E1
MTVVARVGSVTLDCADPGALADFYQAVTGAARAYDDADQVALEPVTPGGINLCFQRVADYRPPRWPDPAAPQQFHLDLYATDPARAAARLEELGATRPAAQPGAGRWTVFLDPAGHPFCLAADPEPAR